MGPIEKHINFFNVSFIDVVENPVFISVFLKKLIRIEKLTIFMTTLLN